MVLPQYIILILAHGGQEVMLCGRNTVGRTDALILLEAPIVGTDGGMERGVTITAFPLLRAVSLVVDNGAVSTTTNMK